MARRCSQTDRLQRLQENGGSPECDTAFVNALRWLKKTQNPDGSWVSGQKVGMTGLALLCFLGHGETVQSEEFSVHVLNAITYLVDIAMKNNGRMADDFKKIHWCYEHAIASLALAEAWALCSKGFNEGIPNLQTAIQKSVMFIINHQHVGGGWDYTYSEDSGRGGDTSVTSWHLQALYAARSTGLKFDKLDDSVKSALVCIEGKQLGTGAIGYSASILHGDGTTQAAAGAASCQLHGQPEQLKTRQASRLLAQKHQI